MPTWPVQFRFHTEVFEQFDPVAIRLLFPTVDRLPDAEEQSSCRESLCCISVCFPVNTGIEGKLSMIVLSFSLRRTTEFVDVCGKPSHAIEEDIVLLNASESYGTCSMKESYIKMTIIGGWFIVLFCPHSCR